MAYPLENIKNGRGEKINEKVPGENSFYYYTL